jgi:flagellar FliJ protein
MAESRAQRMQVVLTLAKRQEQKAGQECSNAQKLLEQDREHLQQLEDYATQYLETYSSRRSGVRAQELIAYSDFIQHLGEACDEQRTRLARMQIGVEKLQRTWRIAHQKCESIVDLIARLEREENHLLDKKLQKEMDELVGQTYARVNDLPSD